MRILLIEDHPIVRMACRRLLLATGGMDIAEAPTAADGLRLSVDFAPDIVLLDLKLPDGSGLEMLSALMSPAPDLTIIVFSMYDDPAFAARALQAGARGYITKNDSPDVLLQAVEQVAAGEAFLTSSMAKKLALMAAGSADGPWQDLSTRERQVLQLLSLGRTLAQIADELNVAYRTAAHITAQIKSKLHIASTAALIKWAVEHPQAAIQPGTGTPGEVTCQ
jgi:DNA-binding NarL/FixJ family response regulator